MSITFIPLSFKWFKWQICAIEKLSSSNSIFVVVASSSAKSFINNSLRYGSISPIPSLSQLDKCDNQATIKDRNVVSDRRLLNILLDLNLEDYCAIDLHRGEENLKASNEFFLLLCGSQRRDCAECRASEPKSKSTTLNHFLCKQLLISSRFKKLK